MREFFVYLSAAATLCAASMASAADIRQGLVAYWQLEGTDGVTTPDATPYNNNLNVVSMSGADFVPGQFGNAAQLNGSTTYMTNLHSPDPSVTGLPIYRAGRYTITMWVKGAAQTAKYLYSEANTANNTPIFILQTGQAAANNAKFDVIIRNDANSALVNHVVSSTVVFDNNWHHIAWVDDNGSVKLYIDGVLDAANFNYTPAGTMTLTSSAIGTLVRTTVSTGAIFNGLIDDVAIWRRALSQAEVLEVKNSSIQTPIPPFPATITAQPIGSTNHVGDRVTFTAVADGSAPLAYQWFKGVTEIPGATSASLTISNLLTDDSADYTLRVANQFGTNVSIAATLLVLPDPAPDRQAGIVSYWSMDDQLSDPITGNGVLNDVYGHNNFKVVADGGFIDLFPGVSTNAAVFNGINQYAYRDGGFPIYNNPAFSVAFWVNANGTNQTNASIFAESSTNNSLPVFSLGSQGAGTNGTLRALIRNSAGSLLLDRTSTRPVLDGTWHHVAWTETNGVVRLYIDGTLDETVFNYTRSGASFLDQTTIGALLNASGATNFLNGWIDELAVWSRALSFTEVQQIVADGIPGPIADQPPTITANPASQSVFTRANVTFAFAASGTGPFVIQWRKDGANLSGETNALFVISNVSPAQAGNYDVVVANALGRATSDVATLTVTLRPSTPELKIDFNNLGSVDDVPANTQPGFFSFALDVASTPGPVTRAYGGAEVTLAAVGGINMQSRKRPLPTNDLVFTDEKLLQDFVFAADATLGQGMDITLNYLDPNAAYEITLWSYDNVSGGNRVSDWSANGIAVTNGYLFNGSTLPTDNSTYRFTFVAASDTQGRIVIQGRRNASATVANNIFINALQAIRHEMRILEIDFQPPAALHLTVEVINPNATHSIEETSSLENPIWTPVLDASFEPPVGNTIEVFFGAPASSPHFYRVVESQ